MNIRIYRQLCVLLMMAEISGLSYADDSVYFIKISKNLFYPDTLTVPAGLRFKLVIENQDPSPEEFDSFELNREKVIMGGTTAAIYIGPLQAGTYPFFGEFNPETAQGKIIALPASKKSQVD